MANNVKGQCRRWIYIHYAKDHAVDMGIAGYFDEGLQENCNFLRAVQAASLLKITGIKGNIIKESLN